MSRLKFTATTESNLKHTYDRYATEQNGSTITKFTQKLHRQNEQCVTTNE